MRDSVNQRVGCVGGSALGKGERFLAPTLIVALTTADVSSGAVGCTNWRRQPGAAARRR